MNAPTTLPSTESPEQSSHTVVAPNGPEPGEQQKSNRDSGSLAKSKQRKNHSWFVWLMAHLFFLLFAVIATFAYAVAAWVSGIELNSAGWKVRTFYFWSDPFTDTQLTVLTHGTAGQFTLDPVIAQHIAGGPNLPALPRWDLVSINRGLRSGSGEATILLEYLKAENSPGDNLWVMWTNNNPLSAPHLWAAVRDAVHLPRYDYLAQIFDTARVHKEPAAFKAEIARIMLALAVDEAERQSAAGNHLATQRAVRMGLSYGDSPRLQALVDVPQ